MFTYPVLFLLPVFCYCILTWASCWLSSLSRAAGICCQALVDSSTTFRGTARHLATSLWWKNVKFTCLIIFIILVCYNWRHLLACTHTCILFSDRASPSSPLAYQRALICSCGLIPCLHVRDVYRLLYTLFLRLLAVVSACRSVCEPRLLCLL